jgi:hypothetical protein
MERSQPRQTTAHLLGSIVAGGPGPLGTIPAPVGMVRTS